MKKILTKYKINLLLSCFVMLSTSLFAQIAPVVQKDSVTENIAPKQSMFLRFKTEKTVEYDPQTKKYIIRETVGGVEIAPPLFLSLNEYKKYRLNHDIKNYYHTKISALNKDKTGSDAARKDLLPTYYVKSDLFKTIFGGNAIEMNTQGSLDVRMGVLYQNIENPQLSEQNRKNTTFDFDQQITASIGAKIGERLKVTANYDTKSTFDFQNLVKVEFLPTMKDGFENEEEDDIIRKIELGNVNMDVSNNLISGAQSLFGLKSQLQFGKTTITSVFSEQKSETKTVRAEGGSSLNEFELRTSQYNANKYFFLAHYFRNNYNKALENFPIINSPVNIINLEVWVTNRTSETENVRNIVALTDAGETGADFYDGNVRNITNTGLQSTDTNIPPFYTSNDVNDLNKLFIDKNNPTSPGYLIKSIGTVKDALAQTALINPTQGTDYTILENAKKLSPSDYKFHPQLGMLTLNRNLTDGDVLAIAFQYTVTGVTEGGVPKVFQVGELSTDGVDSNENLVLKMLRSEIKQPGERIFDLMMKNAYSLGAYQLQKEGFLIEVLYKDDKEGVAINSLQNAISTYPSNGTEVVVSDRTLMNLVKVDSLDQNNFVKEKGDGYFDYVEGVTVDSETGTVIFPTLEPFGRDMAAKLTAPEDDLYLFKEMYTNIQAVAQNDYQTRDKYLLRGYYKSDASNGISLGAFNVPRGSVKVTSNGIELTEGVDYVVDYLGGRVQIINPAIEASGAPVNVSLENNTLFNQQTKRYVGIDVEHKFSDKFQMTATYLNVNERPLTQKVTYGADPINNKMYGATFNYDSEVPWITRMVNRLPFQDTDAASKITVRGDFALMAPGTPKGINQGGEATTYLDDFEGAQIPMSMTDVNAWKLASKPLNFDDYDFGPDDGETLDYGKKRANLAWYAIDRLFYGANSLTPPNIDFDELSRAEVSRVDYNELFPQTDLDYTQSNTLQTFDLAYYPSERGSYNYDTDNIGVNGQLLNPEDRWGGITRGISTNDFQQANVEYIQFWMQDPYENYSITLNEGANGPLIPEGELYFNLGNISEDILKDSRKSYENGLPGVDDLEDSTDPTIWGKVPTNSTFQYAFTESDQDRLLQDVGLDGMSDAEEATKFPDIGSIDRSTDNYMFFRSTFYDQTDASVLTRYKDYNKTEGNSPTANLSTENYPTSATAVPDTEDINRDQTMNTIDAYYQYKVSLNQTDLMVGKNNIVDAKQVVRRTPDGGEKNVTWYQFRIPIFSGTPINGISDFNSIRFMRMYLTKFKSPVVLRFGQLQLVRGDWRRYEFDAHGGMQTEDDKLTEEDLKKFTTGVVNIEENNNKFPIPYVLPPGIQREQLQGSTKLQFQNEQSLLVKVNELPAGETRTVFKNAISDLRMFKKLRMFVHAEGVGTELEDDQMVAIMRLGADLNDNFYQIEVPLKATKFSDRTPEEIWPEQNNFDVVLDSLALLKVKRYAEQGSSGINELYPAPIPNEAPKYRIRIKGNPNLANIKTMMLGVQNRTEDIQSAELWFNELRVAGFDNEGGWAGTVTANANLADLADIALTGTMQTQGFGGVEERVNERSQEDIKQYGLSSNLSAGKLMPKNWGMKIPVSYSVSEEFKDPKFDPKFQDVKFEDAKEVNENSDYARDYRRRSSISFINVRKDRVGTSAKKPMPYNVENFSVSYSYNQEKHQNYNMSKYLDEDVKASANYAYTVPTMSIEPFKNSSMNPKYFRAIKDINFNLLPSTIGVNSNVTRRYNEQSARNLVSGGALPTLLQRNYLFDWDYNIGYNLSRNLRFNLRAANKHIFDSFESLEQEESQRYTLFSDFFNTGRANNYSQKFDVNYELPIHKLPYLGFVTADYNYTADFSWQAGSQSYIYEMGNVIQNANTHNFSTNFNMNTFYRDINLKYLFTPKSKRPKKRKKGKDDGKPKFATPSAPRRIGSKKKSNTEKFLDVAYDLVTMVKTVRLSYADNNGMFLPGYKESVGFLGQSRTSGGYAPTFGFVFGDQRDIRQLALERDWLTTRNINLLGVEDENYYSKTFTKTHYDKFDWSMALKPIKDLDINISANRITTRNQSQQIDAIKDYQGNDTNGDFVRRFSETQVVESSNFSMTYSMFKTAFDGDGDQTFQQFLENRETIAQRLANDNDLDPTKIGLNSQQVLLPAFTAAYSGNSASKEKLGAFKTIPIPNWQLTYKGLMRISWFKSTFSSFVVTHGYKSSYTIANMSNNAQYREENGKPSLDINGNYMSENLVSTLALTDGFHPLVKVDFRLKNSLSFRGEVNTDRTIALSFNNNTISDVRGSEYVFGMGYIVKDVRLRGAAGRRKAIKGDLNLKADIAYRSDLTSVRTIATEYSQVTGGQSMFTFKFSADYNLSRSLIATFYFDQLATRYAISTSYPRQSISSGISVTYNLGN